MALTNAEVQRLFADFLGRPAGPQALDRFVGVPEADVIDWIGSTIEFQDRVDQGLENPMEASFTEFNPIPNQGTAPTTGSSWGGSAYGDATNDANNASFGDWVTYDVQQGTPGPGDVLGANSVTRLAMQGFSRADQRAMLENGFYGGVSPSAYQELYGEPMPGDYQQIPFNVNYVNEVRGGEGVVAGPGFTLPPGYNSGGADFTNNPNTPDVTPLLPTTTGPGTNPGLGSGVPPDVANPLPPDPTPGGDVYIPGTPPPPAGPGAPPPPAGPGAPPPPTGPGITPGEEPPAAPGNPPAGPPAGPGAPPPAGPGAPPPPAGPGSPPAPPFDPATSPWKGGSDLNRPFYQQQFARLLGQNNSFQNAQDVAAGVRQNAIDNPPTTNMADWSWLEGGLPDVVTGANSSSPPSWSWADGFDQGLTNQQLFDQASPQMNDQNAQWLQNNWLSGIEDGTGFRATWADPGEFVNTYQSYEPGARNAWADFANTAFDYTPGFNSTIPDGYASPNPSMQFGDSFGYQQGGASSFYNPITGAWQATPAAGVGQGT